MNVKGDRASRDLGRKFKMANGERRQAHGDKSYGVSAEAKYRGLFKNTRNDRSDLTGQSKSSAQRARRVQRGG